MKKVVLVFPRFRYPSGDFSLGLAHVGAYLRRHVDDLDLSLLDTTSSPTLEYARGFLAERRPAVVGIMADTLMFDDALAVARLAKEGGATVILGGPHPTILPETAFGCESVDAVCIGEGEHTMTEFVEECFGEGRFERVKGIWFRRGGRVVKTTPRPPVADLDSLPFPAVDLFDVEAYIGRFVQLDSYDQSLPGMSTIVSRGCPFRCAYCQPTLRRLFGKRLRIRSPENVLAELKELKGRYGIRAVYFQDDTLTIFRKWMRRFCELMSDEREGLVWACNTRADTIDLETLRMMKAAGCVKIKVGIESVTDRIRNGIYGKNVSREEIEALLAWCGGLGIQLTGFFMLGAPTETDGEVLRTILFAGNSGLDEANFSIATPLPGTDLYRFVEERGWRLPRGFGSFDYYQVRRPRMSRDEVSEWRLKVYKKLANLYFYLHPRRILSTLRIVFGRGGLRKLLFKLRRL